ncbi:DENN domain-containing protein 3 [Lonchura striata]|uniref:DENN domain-containing protein 3 n=1 Tax=Lonchura striata TaxID=40157 RepID=A0A218U8J5_9PASE|nr:DENN domain-containing protein 3 [Lonchura striata domestica]
MEDVLPSGLLEICLLVGASTERVRALLQGTQRKLKNLPPLDPEVLSVFVPPFISRDDVQMINAGNNLNKSKRRSFRKKKERPKVENVKSLNGEQKAPDTEDVTVPKDIDLIALPQLCFPVKYIIKDIVAGFISGGLYVTSESKEDHIHFLVFTDVCGNRTYGVVAQYYQSMQVFHMKPLQIIIPSREDPDSPIIDLDLHLPLLCFKPEQVLQWQHTFVPILSRQMLDFVMAPTSFLMGCHTEHFDEVSMEGEDLILINIDNGDISYSKMVEEELDIPDVPAQAAETFIKRVEGLQLHFDLELCHLRASTDLGELQTRRRAWQQKLNMEVQQTMLQLIVNIFREVKDHLNYEHRVFNSEEFLKTRAIGDQPFYKKVLETYMFHSFLKARLNRKMDAFARLDLSTQSEEDRLDLMFPTPRRLTIEKMASKRMSAARKASRRMVISMPNLQDIQLPQGPTRNSSLRKVERGVAIRTPSKSITTFKIPEIHFPLMFQCVHSYYTDFFNHLSKAISTLPPENSVLLARKIVETLPRSERLQADRKPELKRLISRVMEKQREVLKIDDHVKHFELPKTHMQLDDFVKRIQDFSHERGFKNFLGQQKQIDPETFRDFYNYWKETEAEAQEVNLPPAVIEHLDKNECVYKLSCSVKTNYGVGKIALTQKRLFLLTEGGRPGYVPIAAFRDIEVSISFLSSGMPVDIGYGPYSRDVKSTTVAFLLLRIPTLRIKTLTKKEVFEANLKTECDLWYLIVKEMWAGKKMAYDHKDPQYIQQALTNVLLMDAVVGALQSSKSIYAASKLSYFDRMKNEGQSRMRGFDGVDKRHLDPSERLDNAHPKLWCALNEGKVVVFDASTWSIQQHCFKMGRSKLTCMVMVEQSQVWIGSQDSIIYIINTHSMSCNKQLNDHRSDVTDIIVEKRNGTPRQNAFELLVALGRVLAEGLNLLSSHGKSSSSVSRSAIGAAAYSSSLDGMVIAWNISTLKVNRICQLSCQNLTSMKLHNDQLWCYGNFFHLHYYLCIFNIEGTRSCILVVSTHEFELQMKIEHHLKDVCSSFLGFQLFPERDEVWASYSGSSDLYIWSTKDLSSTPQKIHLQDCSEITCMIRVKNQLWVGSSGKLQGKSKGKIYVVSAERKSVEKELVGHADAVKALCSAEDRYVLSGSGKEEGKIAIWKAG